MSGSQPLPGSESDLSLAERRVMRTIGSDGYVPVLGIRRAEVWLLLYSVIGAAAIGGVLADITGVNLLFQTTAALGLLLSVGAITASPEGMSTTKWLNIAIRYVLRPKVIRAASAEAPVEERNEGGVLNYTPFEPDDRTQDYTGVQEAFPGAGAVLRDDFQMEAFVEVIPDNMDFATEEEWRAKQRIAKRYVNHTQKGEIKMHATTRGFDLDSLTERLDDRASDRDIQARPVMRRLIEEYRTRRPREMRQQGVQEVSFYFGVTVDEQDVEDTYADEPTPIEKLSRVTVFGALFSPFVERASDLPPEERRARMIAELDSRIQNLRSELTEKMPGWTDRRLSTVEMLTLNARYWNGAHEETYDALERVMGGGPALRRSARPTPDYPNEDESAAEDERGTITGIEGPFEQADSDDDPTPTRQEYQMEERRNRLAGGLVATATAAASAIPTVPLTLPGPRIGTPMTPGAYNTIFGWLPEASAVSEPTAAPLAGILMYLVGLLAIGGIVSGMREDEEAEERGFSVGDLLAEERRHQDPEGPDIGSEVGPGAVRTGEGATVDDLGTRQNRIMAANEIEEDTRVPKVGEQYVKTLFFEDIEDIPSDGFLSPLFETTDIEFDLTAYAIPKFQPSAVEDLRSYADDLTVDAQDEDSAREDFLAQQAQRARMTHQAAENGTRVMDLGVYLTIRGDDPDAVEEADQRVRSVLTDNPANTVPGTVIGKQDLAVQSVAPLGPDALGESDPDQYRHVALAGGIGALFVSPTNPTMFEEDGIEMGIHKHTRAPLVVDPFNRDNGYARFVIAQQGSGKSYDAKVTLTRLLRDRDDVRGVVLEPMGNWAGVSAAMQASEDPDVTAERIVIGGKTALNPLEIRPITPQDARDLGRDYDPLSSRIQSVQSFLYNYLAGRGFTDAQIAERQVQMEEAVAGAYAEQGLEGPADVITPAGEEPEWTPPTMVDVLDQLEDRARNPGEYVTRTEGEAEAVKENAEWLLDKFGPFEGGEFDNLGKPSEFDIGNADLIYLDLGQAEGDLGLKAALTMQLLVTKVYEEAKETDDKLVLAMDEFRYILEHATNLDFMGTLFRHHRHYEISPWIITQTVNEFLDHPDPEAKALLESCTIQQFHKLPEMDREIAETFDMNGAMARFVAREASAGEEGDAYSDTLLGISGEWRRAEFRATPAEHRVSEWDPRKHYPTELPGITEANKHLVYDQDPAGPSAQTTSTQTGAAPTEPEPPAESQPDRGSDERAVETSEEQPPNGREKAATATAPGTSAETGEPPAANDTPEAVVGFGAEEPEANGHDPVEPSEGDAEEQTDTETAPTEDEESDPDPQQGDPDEAGDGDAVEQPGEESDESQDESEPAGESGADESAAEEEVDADGEDAAGGEDLARGFGDAFSEAAEAAETDGEAEPEAEAGGDSAPEEEAETGDIDAGGTVADPEEPMNPNPGEGESDD